MVVGPLRRDAAQSNEAAMKYYVLGALASGFLLYGISMLYGATGSFEVPLLLSGALLVGGALCFGLLIKKVEPIRRPELETLAT